MKVLNKGTELEFILAGCAIFTVKNESTGNRFTYKVVKCKEPWGWKDQELYWIRVLTGSDNNSHYSYMAILSITNGRWNVKFTTNSSVNKEAQSAKVFLWLFNRLWKRVNGEASNIPDIVKIYHEGRCGKCGRRLTVPESIKSGFGPKCINSV